jgi:hypothetical protein
MSEAWTASARKERRLSHRKSAGQRQRASLTPQTQTQTQTQTQVEEAVSMSRSVESRRIDALRSHFFALVEKCFPSRELAARMAVSSSIPEEVRTKYELQLIQFTEKAFDSIKKSILVSFYLHT